MNTKEWVELLHVLYTSLGSIIALFLLTKLMGYRQMSQLSMFDYINGITIGSIAAEMATSLENDFLKPLLAMVVYSGVVIIFSFITDKSIIGRRILAGRSIILMDNGKLYNKNLSKARIDMGEFLIQCRNYGYFNLSNIETAILESNGKISFLPKSGQRPATPDDLGLSPAQEGIVANVILDGNILYENLKNTGNNKKWLETELQKQRISSVRDVFLATCDMDNNLSVYMKVKEPMKRDIFE